ncbi:MULTISPECIES: hypothetical protein [Variovorax]|uniref:hypothetical protein n=1 Tax=Variovorax TaxID=34072 RepID=UPI001D7C3CD9|nr:hypothetical protein [Variovorax paradoxus]MBW8718268.1 hypothetical protein [Variovorax paradoxus]
MENVLEIVLWGVFGIVSLGVIVLAAIVLTVSLMSHRAYAEEGRLWQQLQASGRPLQGVAVSLVRSPSGYSRRGPVGQRMTAVQLGVAYVDADGIEQQTTLRTLIDEDLLAHFSAGRPDIHLLQDPQDPSRLAIDRRHTPLVIRGARR